MSNTSIISINNQEAAFENKDEQVFCTSLGMTKVFSKQHKHVLESVDEKLSNNEIKNSCEPNFRLSLRTCKIEGFRDRGRKYPYRQLTKNGFSFMTVRLTDRKADRFKITLINTLSEMEEIIENQCIPKPENYNKYKIPNTPYRENIIKAIMQTEQDRNCEFEELVTYEVKEIYKDSKSHTEQKINFKVKELI